MRLGRILRQKSNSKKFSNCSDYVDYMQVESNGTEAIIDLYMEKPPEIDILNPQGIPVTQFNVFNSKTNALVVFSQSSHDNPGIWTLTLDKNNTNPGMCLVW